MKCILTVPLILVPTLWMSQVPEVPTKVLIARLGSTIFLERQAAIKALQERPEAAPLLRENLRSSDPEIRRRAREILDYYDLQPVRELTAAVKDGRADRFIDLLSSWPKGRHEEEVWSAFRNLAHSLVQLHQKKGGLKIRLDNMDFYARQGPIVLTAKKITKAATDDDDGILFLRAAEVDLDARKEGVLHRGAFTVAARSVRVLGGGSHLIFAGQSVDVLGNEGFVHSIIVCGGDVTLNGPVGRSLVIARGSVTATGYLEGNRIIAGKKIATAREPVDCTITENEPNPLGFIRWADAPTEKAKPKAK